MLISFSFHEIAIPYEQHRISVYKQLYPKGELVQLWRIRYQFTLLSIHQFGHKLYDPTEL